MNTVKELKILYGTCQPCGPGEKKIVGNQQRKFFNFNSNIVR